MTLPPSDAQSSKYLPHHSSRPDIVSPPSSIPPHAQLPLTPPAAGFSDDVSHDRAIDFASHSWDLATGGLKTLTAKRELPSHERRSSGMLPEHTQTPRNYAFMLIILSCLVLMLISIGFVLFMMVQP